MMRTLLVVALLLASVGIAFAECAWVLWRNVENEAPAKAVQRPVPSNGWQPVATEVDRGACWNTEKALRDTESNAYLVFRGNRVRLTESRPGSFLIYYYDEGERLLGALQYRYNCLPDTVDPRRPRRE